MRSKRLISCIVLSWLAFLSPLSASDIKPTPIRFVPLQKVVVEDEFWKPILDRNRTVTIPYLFQKAEETGIIDNFIKAAGKVDGDSRGLPNSDEVLYKAIEAASYSLARHPDPKLDAYLDKVIAKIAAAQEEDGYLFTPRTIALRKPNSKSRPRWSNLGADLELYMCAHLYEAATAHYAATGKKNLLDVAIKNANLLTSLFGPGKRRDVCGHPNIEQALVRLWSATGNDDYWRLAKFFVDERGRANGRELRGPFSQDHKPITLQTEAVGQAPRATYLYSGVADIARTTDDPLYLRALEKLWGNVLSRKMYITGGIGSRAENEGFGPDYELPNLTGFSESCAAVSFSMWNQRMYTLTGEAKYLDVLERTLYNNLLAGVSLSGDQFFYACPVESDGELKFNRGWVPKELERAPHAEATATRKPWFVCACCPPNIARYLEQVPGLIYATSPDSLMVNLFVKSQLECTVGGRTVRVAQETRYPWDGKVSLRLSTETEEQFAVKIRVPGWATEAPVPSDLYTFVPARSKSAIAVLVNGQETRAAVENGYLTINRKWNTSDVIQVEFPMPVRRLVCNPAVQENRDKVAITRGPLVYCVEEIDNEGAARSFVLADGSSLHEKFRPDFLGGIMTIVGLAKTANAQTRSQAEAGRQSQLHPLTAIPYFTWSNRGAGEMVVWLWREAN